MIGREGVPMLIDTTKTVARLLIDRFGLLQCTGRCLGSSSGKRARTSVLSTVLGFNAVPSLAQPLADIAFVATSIEQCASSIVMAGPMRGGAGRS
jgi:hypothetical protein